MLVAKVLKGRLLKSLSRFSLSTQCLDLSTDQALTCKGFFAFGTTIGFYKSKKFENLESSIGAKLFELIATSPSNQTLPVSPESINQDMPASTKTNPNKNTQELNIEEEFRQFSKAEKRLKESFELNDFIANQVSQNQLKKQQSYMKYPKNSLSHAMEKEKIYALLQNLEVFMDKTLDLYYLPLFDSIKMLVEQLKSENVIKSQKDQDKIFSGEQLKISLPEKKKHEKMEKFQENQNLSARLLQQKELEKERKQMKIEMFKDIIRRICQLSNENIFILRIERLMKEQFSEISQNLLSYLYSQGTILQKPWTEFSDKNISVHMNGKYPTLEKIHEVISKKSPQKQKNKRKIHSHHLIGDQFRSIFALKIQEGYPSPFFLQQDRFVNSEIRLSNEEASQFETSTFLPTCISSNIALFIKRFQFHLLSGYKYMGKSMSLALYAILKSYGLVSSVIIIPVSMNLDDIVYLIQNFYEACWKQLSNNTLLKMKEIFKMKNYTLSQNVKSQNIFNLLTMITQNRSTMPQIIFDQFSTVIGLDIDQDTPEELKIKINRIFSMIDALNSNHWPLVFSSSIAVELKHMNKTFLKTQQESRRMVLSFMMAGSQLEYLLRVWLQKCYYSLPLPNAFDLAKLNFCLELIELCKPGSQDFKLFLNIDEIKTAAKSIFFQFSHNFLTKNPKIFDSTSKKIIFSACLEKVLKDDVMSSISDTLIFCHTNETYKWINKGKDLSEIQQRQKIILQLLGNGSIENPQKKSAFSGYLPLFLCKQNGRIRQNVDPMRDKFFQELSRIIGSFTKTEIQIFIGSAWRLSIKNPSLLGQYLQIFLRLEIQQINTFNSILPSLFEIQPNTLLDAISLQDNMILNSLRLKYKHILVKTDANTKERIQIAGQKVLEYIGLRQAQKEINRKQKEQDEQETKQKKSVNQLKRTQESNLQIYQMVRQQKRYQDQKKKKQRLIKQAQKLVKDINQKMSSKIQAGLFENEKMEDIIFSIRTKNTQEKCDGILIKVCQSETKQSKESQEPKQNILLKRQFTCEVSFYEI